MKMPNAIAATGGPLVTLTAAGISETVGNPGPAIARVELRLDGTVFELSSGAPSQLFPATDWIFPRNGDLSNYEVMAVQNSGDALDGSSDVLNTWLALTSNRSWGLTNSSNNSLSVAGITVSIRIFAVVKDTANYGFTATVGNPP